MSTYLNAHAKVKYCIFDSQLSGNWFEFSLIEKDSWSSKILANQIQDSFPGFNNPKTPGIQPSHVKTSCNIKSHLSGLERVLEKGKIFMYNHVYSRLFLFMVRLW